MTHLNSQIDTETSSTVNASNGVYSRLIDDWLTNTKERGFEVPFCHLLISEGYDILHIDSHSQTEDGKDVIAISPDGYLCGFQLKAGDVTAGAFGEMMTELRELVEYKCHVPRAPKRLCDRAYLVVTGRLNVTANHKLNEFNNSRREGTAAVELIDKSALHRRFIDSTACAIPVDAKRFGEYLAAMLTDPHECVSVPDVLKVIEAVLESADATNAKMKISSSFVAISHIFAKYAEQRNHLALAECWSLAAIAAIRSIAVGGKVEDMKSVAFACDIAYKSLVDLSAEAIAHKTLIEGDVFGDGGDVFKARIQMLCGIVAAAELCRVISDHESKLDESKAEWIVSNIGRALLWGESAAPYVFCIFWYLSLFPKFAIDAENYLLSYIETVASANCGGKYCGIADPYCTFEWIMRVRYGMVARPDAGFDFRLSAFTVWPAVLLLAKRLRRQSLAARWNNISSIAIESYEVDDARAFMSYRSAEAKWISRFPERPTKWSKLLAEADQPAHRAESEAFKLLCVDPRLPLLFLLVFPHRLTVGFAKLLDSYLDVVGGTPSAFNQHLR
jgi:hypothetical protein